MLPDYRQRGVTLIEMVIAMVVVGIVVAATIFFAYPLRQAVDTKTRAELTDIADNALQRVGREVRLALPNSIRVTASGSSIYLEFLAVRTAGRYRAEGGGASSGTDCPAGGGVTVPDADQLSFGTSDTCFKSIGIVPNSTDIQPNSDFLVLNNYGAIALPTPDFPGQDAYEAAATNRVLITGVDVEASRTRISFGATTFRSDLHNSPSRRFYVVSGPVTYQCDLAAHKLVRHAGYAISAAQPTPAAASGVDVAHNVAACAMDYNPNGVAARIGLLTLQLQLSKTVSSGSNEAVALYHAVHVNNVP
jgi:MSHA biogenesis protein MshO